jgi:GNAT superfamily N-acetyltransferase
MERVLNSAMAYGEAFATEDLSGVMFLLPPGHTRLTNWEYVKCGFLAAPLKIGLRRYAAVNASEECIADEQDRLLSGRARYYLWGLAVDPAKQRSGAGTAFLKILFEKADREDVPVYLETHQFRNVAYYEARGFKLIHTAVMPLDALPFYCMLREPGGFKE